MAKKKVYCYNCAYFLKSRIKYAQGATDGHRIPNACGNPDYGVSLEKVNETAIKPAHSRMVSVPPEEINKNNDCKGWMFLAEKPEYKQPKKSWWKIWGNNG